MGKFLSLLKFEIKNIWKQTVLFTLVSVLMLAFSSGVLCFAGDMRSAYASFMDYKSLKPLCVYIDNAKEDKLSDAMKLVDTILSQTILNGVFTYRDKEISDKNCPEDFAYLMGEGIKTNNVPMEEQEMIFIEGGWGYFEDKQLEDNSYPILISSSMSKMLDAHMNDNIYFTADSYDTPQAFKIVGVYTHESSPYRCYFAALSGIYAAMENVPMRLLIYFNQPSDSLTAIPKLKALGYEITSASWPIETNTVVLAMEAVLYIVAVLFIIATCFILGNILTVTLRRRQQHIAELKLLGASNNTIASTYYIWLVIAFIISIGVGIIASVFLCGYLSRMAELILTYPAKISFKWSTALILIGVSTLTFLIQFFLFRRKIKKVSAIALVKEE